jgi:hypothetical protein
MDFLIAVVGLCLIVGLIFLALDRIAPDDGFKKIARWAVGGAALIMFLLAIKGVLFGGGGGGLGVSPLGLISFAFGMIVLLVVLYIVYMAVDFLAPAEFVVPIKYVIGALAIIAMLYLAAQVLTGGALLGAGGGGRGISFLPLR